MQVKPQLTWSGLNARACVCDFHAQLHVSEVSSAASS